MIESDCKMKIKVDVDLELVKMKTTRKVKGITVITETIAHESIIEATHRKNLKINTANTIPTESFDDPELVWVRMLKSDWDRT